MEKKWMLGACLAATALLAQPVMADSKWSKRSHLNFTVGDTNAEGSGRVNEALMPYLQTVDFLGKNLRVYLDQSQGFIKLQSAMETVWEQRNRHKH